MFRYIYLIIVLASLFSVSSSRFLHRNLLQNGGAPPCPLNFEALRPYIQDLSRPSLSTRSACQYISQGLRLVYSDHLRRTNSFLPSVDSAESCWDSYQSLVNESSPGFDIRRRCGFQTPWIATGCMNISTRADFEALVPQSALNNTVTSCNQSLVNSFSSPCASCTAALSTLQAPLQGPSTGNVTDCTAYPFIYAGAFLNHFGPGDEGTARCLFNLDSTRSNSGARTRNIVISVLVSVFGVVLIMGVLGFWLLRRRNSRYLMKKWNNLKNQSNVSSGLDSISESTTLIKFTFEEIKAATKNFSRQNMIGKGGYGNVYKGVLPDGSEVAFKRFKNCSASGDASFAHEVEVIASVRHVNLVGLRGYCTATTHLEGHQRIIVCDLMKNGSLHDHLFEWEETKLSWPIRQKIALGTARGLAYLHCGAQQSIIHRDIKGSNILLDENFEPKLADFGLAKFTPEGMTHLSTKVAGTMGYVAPEYALYGQVTERSDVYSFGIVLLELLSGKKALLAVDDGQPTLVADWAWSFVRKGRVMAVVEKDMPDLGPRDVVEKYVLVAILCSHPQPYARPTMDQVVKILDMDVPVPAIPDRPISLIANIDDIERSASSSGSGNMSSSDGYQPFTS